MVRCSEENRVRRRTEPRKYSGQKTQGGAHGQGQTVGQQTDSVHEALEHTHTHAHTHTRTRTHTHVHTHTHTHTRTRTRTRTHTHTCTHAHMCRLSPFSCVRLFVTPRTIPTRVPCPGDSPGKNTGEVCHALLQWIFPTPGSGPCVSHLPH